jgi:hypothetical protein
MWITLVGLSYGYDYTLGAMLRVIADAADIRIWKIHLDIGSPIDKVDHKIRDAIAAGIQKCEYAMARLWHGLEWLARKNADALAEFAGDVETAWHNLTAAEIPQQITSHTVRIAKSVATTAHATDVRIRRGEHAIYRGIDQLRRDLTREAQASIRGIDDLRKLVGNVVVPDIRALDHAVSDVVGYTRRNLARRLTRVEHLVLGGAIVGAALATLTRYFPYWQCTNVRRFNRLLCRAPVGLPEELFGFLLAAGTIASFRELVMLGQAITRETVEEIHAIARVT